MTATNSFDKLITDIASLKIQGAENIARAAAKGVAKRLKERGKVTKKDLTRLLTSRPTEPMMLNAVSYVLEQATPSIADKVVKHLLKKFDEVDEQIAQYAAGLMKDDGVYFTHCHSSTVIKAFLAAKKEGKHFEVRNTETRPLFQGRATAQELAKQGIHVVHGSDSAARVLIKDCDAVFLGADALFSDSKVANKIGSEMIAELAYTRKIPVYILASSWKYASGHAERFIKRLEERAPAEIWKEPPENVTVENPAFEFIMPNFIKAIVTEHGIHDPGTTIQLLTKQHIDEKKH